MDSRQTCQEVSPEVTDAGQLFPCVSSLQPCFGVGSRTAVEPGLPLAVPAARCPAKPAGTAAGASHSGQSLEFLPGQPQRQMLQDYAQPRSNLPRLQRLHFWGKNLRWASFPKVSIKSFQDCWFWGNLDGMPLASAVLASERFHQTCNRPFQTREVFRFPQTVSWHLYKKTFA